jgi:hypothetical protein
MGSMSATAIIRRDGNYTLKDPTSFSYDTGRWVGIEVSITVNVAFVQGLSHLCSAVFSFKFSTTTSLTSTYL